jgi:Hemerythrin HHE cation binding domain
VPQGLYDRSAAAVAVELDPVELLQPPIRCRENQRARLADLLAVHTQAEEETCYLPLLGTGGQATERMRDSIADHEDIRGTIGEAAVQPVGSAAWWHTVRTVMAVSAEHLEHEERDVLPVWLAGLSMSRRKELGRRWCAFVAAWRPDATFA